MSDLHSFLQAMFKEQCDQAPQHETMRQQSTTLVLAVSAALATVAGAALSATVQPLMMAKVPWVVALYGFLGWVVVQLAALGKALSLKHYERNKLHLSRARMYRKRLSVLFPAGDHRMVNKEADKDHEDEWATDGLPSSIIHERLHQYWIDIYGFVRYLGTALIVIPVGLAIALTLVTYFDPLMKLVTGLMKLR